jgi:hypothetical protein
MAFSQHNVVATFLDEGQAKEAIGALKNTHFDDSEISFLSRTAEATVSQNVDAEEAEEMPREVGAKSAEGAGGGAVAGGIAGLVAGGVALAIPGIGPAFGAGIWAISGAVAGATAGGVASGISKMWEERYRDQVREGAILVGVHSDDRGRVELATGLLRRQGPDRLDLFDADGKPIE